MDGVVPVTVKAVRFHLDSGHLLLGDLDAERVGAVVDLGADRGRGGSSRIAFSTSSGRVCDRLRAVYPEADYQAVLTELAAHGELVPDAEDGKLVTADQDDDKFMRCAHAAGAVVVSGDRHLLDATGWRQVRVLAPAEFLASLPTSEPGAT